MEQLLAHLVGDYVLQSHWMATNKTKSVFPAAIHAATYTAPFLFLTQNILTIFIICFTHFLIDHFRLARYVSYTKNFLAPNEITDAMDWEDYKETGYHKDVPPWLSVWLMIITDNTMHLLINYLALKL
jgi:hypothetical protein